MKRALLFWPVVAATIAAVARPTPARAQAYEVTTDIPALSANPQMYVAAMNNAAQVTGWGYNSQGYQRAFLFDGTNTLDLGTLGGAYSSGLRINANGHVIGWSYTSNNNYQQAFLYEGGALIPIAFSATSYSYPTGINSAGDVIGSGNRPGYGQRPFIYTGGAIVDLNDVTAASGWQLQYAVDINDNGQILVHGYNQTLGQWRSAVLTPSGGAYTLADLGTLGGTYTYGQDINASGQVAGYSSLASGSQRAFLYSPVGGITDLGTFGGDYSSAIALNDAGQVAGWAYTTGNSEQHGFLYSAGSKQDLGAGRYPRAINAAGLILGENFLYSNGAVRDLQGVIGRCRSYYYYYYGYNAINDSGQMAFGTSYYYSSTAAFIASPAQNAEASFDLNGAGASYNGSTYLWARLWAGCSWMAGKQVEFSLNGSAVGTATTDQYGQAVLPSASAAGIEPGYYAGGVSVSFAGDADVTAATANASLWIYKLNPVLSWSPASLVEGTPLAAAQLNAVANVPGTFYYSPDAGTVLPAGLNSLYATFQPNDSAHYESGGIQSFLAVRAQAPALMFDATEVPGLGGTWLDVRDLNNAGQVTGIANTAAGRNHAFVFANGFTTDLGTLGGSYDYSDAKAVNASGQVTGNSYNTNNRWRAYLYSNGTMTDLGALPGSYYEQSVAEDINDSGHVVGWSYNSSGYQRAFRSAGGTMIDLGVLAGGRWSVARFINNDGQIAGTSETCASTCGNHAFLFDQGAMIDLGTLGGTSSEVTAMNASGQIVGYSYLANNSSHQAFIYRDGAMVNLGTLGGSWSLANGINDAGEVTGWSYTNDNQAVHAFKYSNGVMTDLGSLTSGWSSSEAYQINSASQVVGYTQNAQGHQVGFLHASGAIYDLNALIDSNQIGAIQYARLLNDPGQIAGATYWNGQQRVFLLTPKNLQQSSLTSAPASGPSAGSATLSATLTSAGSPLVGQTVFFRINGSPAGSVVTDASGVATLSGVSLAGIQPGSYAAGVSATFPGAPGVGGSSATAALHVNNLPTVSWSNPAAIVYGTALSAAQLNATASVPGTFIYTPAAGTVLSVGDSQTLSVTFNPTDGSYSVAVATVSINVTKATPTVTWGNPAGIAYGTALSASQLNATASVAGAFTYTPPAGTLLDVGDNQTLSVSFTPTDTANYNSVPVTTVSINVAKATPVVTWNNPSAIVYGTPLGGTQLNASANVPGQFVYSPAAGAVLNAGAGQTLSVTFTPNDAARYNSAGKTIVLTVNRAPLTVTADNKAMVLNGVIPALTATYTGFVNGDTTASLTPAASLGTTATGAAVGTFAITAAGAVHPNYTINHVPGTLTVAYATGMCLGDTGRQVLSPLNADGSSVVKRGSTVPVKFRVCDVNGHSVGTPGVVSNFVMTQVLSGTVAADLEAIESTTPDSAFRWDASAQQWVFNMSTKNQTANRTYVYRITLADQSTIEFRYGVR